MRHQPTTYLGKQQCTAHCTTTWVDAGTECHEELPGTIHPSSQCPPHTPRGGGKQPPIVPPSGSCMRHHPTTYLGKQQCTAQCATVCATVWVDAGSECHEELPGTIHPSGQCPPYTPQGGGKQPPMVPPSGSCMRHQPMTYLGKQQCTAHCATVCATVRVDAGSEECHEELPGTIHPSGQCPPHTPQGGGKQPLIVPPSGSCMRHQPMTYLGKQQCTAHCATVWVDAGSECREELLGTIHLSSRCPPHTPRGGGKQPPMVPPSGSWMHHQPMTYLGKQQCTAHCATVGWMLGQSAMRNCLGPSIRAISVLPIIHGEEENNLQWSHHQDHACVTSQRPTSGKSSVQHTVRPFGWMLGQSAVRNCLGPSIRAVGVLPIPHAEEENNLQWSHHQDHACVTSQ